MQCANKSRKKIFLSKMIYISKTSTRTYLFVLNFKGIYFNLKKPRIYVRLCHRYHELQDFLNYFEMNYLNGNFSVQMWNVYERNMDNRTNNSVESKYNFCICPYYEPVILYVIYIYIRICHRVICSQLVAILDFDRPKRNSL
jgi:hypothetical protein